MHFITTILLHLFFFNILRASSMSFFVASPVDIKIGFLVFATFEIRGTSVISGEAILYIGRLFFSKKSTVFKSKTEENNIILFLSHIFFNFEYQL